MTRFAGVLLALSLMASGALAASPEAAYLAARDKYIAEIKAFEDSKASESAIQAAENKAVADLEKRLRDIVGPVAVKGFPPADTLNLALREHDEEFGDLDGLTSNSEGQDVVVTTRPLLMAWLEQMVKDEVKDRRLPTDVDAAVRQDGFYTFSLGADAAFAKYADLPVMKPPGADLAVGALGVFQADGPWTRIGSSRPSSRAIGSSSPASATSLRSAKSPPAERSGRKPSASKRRRRSSKTTRTIAPASTRTPQRSASSLA